MLYINSYRVLSKKFIFRKNSKYFRKVKLIISNRKNKKKFNTKKLILKDNEFLYNKTFAKLYECGDTKKVKLVLMKQVHNSNIDAPPKDCSNRGQVNDAKLVDNISRTKQKIFELAFCNPWQFFFTGTLDSKKYNRTDLEKYHKDFSKWIQNYNRLHNCNIKFLVVPELHSDGKSWHLHGFLMGIPLEDLEQFKIGDKMGKAIAEKVKNGDIVLNWLAYQEKFGFCDLEPIRNHEAIAKYVTKYINKELAKSVTALNAHQYYRSRDLKGAKELKKEHIDWRSISPDFSNEYCKIKWLDYNDYLKLFNS